MSKKHIVVHGATVKCSFSVEPKTDTLQVKSQSRHYANDKKGSEKLIATDKELGLTCEKNTFGKCKLLPNGSGDFLPCKCVVQGWTHSYKKVTLSNGGKILTEESKATCPIGGPGCITIDKHGQKTSGGSTNSKTADKKTHTQINPLVNIAAIGKEKYHANGITLNL